eukprot:CAMPEP_0117600114 /NCGR_PEP_ID=MMETSP0784-20121206/76305_1 /TAXON_ID=39447 /ORGANISM="" /LENGTH=118 /DNA_ID=CAMNT_0005402705 /DNA_START=193 /DNA_END=550 /DNA_ORIENTATION=+
MEHLKKSAVLFASLAQLVMRDASAVPRSQIPWLIDTPSLAAAEIALDCAITSQGAPPSLWRRSVPAQVFFRNTGVPRKDAGQCIPKTIIVHLPVARIARGLASTAETPNEVPAVANAV